ncbi:MAG: NUDIX domain-containing protein [Bacteroidia bacterium]|nr:NUDIX domain-containing protein [Bacteroidia bacterium]
MSHSHLDKIEPLSIDCVVFGFEAESHDLKILLIKRAIEPNFGSWALPGGFILYSEGIDEASNRILNEMTGIENLYLKQLRAFGEVKRYPDKRVITLSYYALVKPGNYTLTPGEDASAAEWFLLSDCPELPFDHQEILNEAIYTLRREVRNRPIGFELLPEKFTLLQLQKLYEAILGIELDKSNFRRKIQRMNLLVKLDEWEENVAHRAARLFKFDKGIYDDLQNKGLIFDV